MAASPAPALAEPIGAELAVAIERHRTALAAQEAAGLVQGERERFTRARPDDAAAHAAFAAADDAFNASCSREQDAHNAVIGAPILTLADMRAKAAYLASVSRHMIHDGDTMAALLASMGGAAKLSDLTTEIDPLLAAVEAYRRACAEFEAVAPDDDDEAEAALYRTIHPQWVALKENPPAATTEAGAVAALRLALEEMNHSRGSFERPLIGAALAYFDGRA